jgi:hypothetical protein
LYGRRFDAREVTEEEGWNTSKGGECTCLLFGHVGSGRWRGFGWRGGVEDFDHQLERCRRRGRGRGGGRRRRAGLFDVKRRDADTLKTTSERRHRGYGKHVERGERGREDSDTREV